MLFELLTLAPMLQEDICYSTNHSNTPDFDFKTAFKNKVTKEIDQLKYSINPTPTDSPI